MVRVVRPLDEPEDTVSIESVPFSNEPDIVLGTGGIRSAGANSPFFVADTEREVVEKRFLALGAEATRRMNRVADALMALGDNGPGRDVEGVDGRTKEGCGGIAVGSLLRVGARPGAGSFSDLVRALDPVVGRVGSASVEGCRRWYELPEYDIVCGGIPPFESLDWVLDEL